MPTGYTADIAKGISFEQFVWNCARAFGALVMMRDEPSSTPVPEKFAPSDFYTKALAEERAKRDAIMRMSAAEVVAAAAGAHRAKVSAWVQRGQERDTLRMQYEDMKARVFAWTPPTAEHVELRTFMLQQIDESIKWDCAGGYDHEPEAVSAESWHAGEIQRLSESIARYEEEQAKEIARTASRNEWVNALRASVPQPAP